jgi:hypothetical protein
MVSGRNWSSYENNFASTAFRQTRSLSMNRLALYIPFLLMKHRAVHYNLRRLSTTQLHQPAMPLVDNLQYSRSCQRTQLFIRSRADRRLMGPYIGVSSPVLSIPDAMGCHCQHKGFPFAGEMSGLLGSTPSDLGAFTGGDPYPGGQSGRLVCPLCPYTRDCMAPKS